MPSGGQADSRGRYVPMQRGDQSTLDLEERARQIKARMRRASRVGECLHLKRLCEIELVGHYRIQDIIFLHLNSTQIPIGSCHIICICYFII